MEKDLAQIRNKIVNAAILVFATLGSFSQLFSTLRSAEYGFEAIYFIQTFLVLFIYFIVIRRKHLSFVTKTIAVTVIAIVVIVTGLYKYGVLATAKNYIITVSIFLSFLLPFRKTLWAIAVFSVFFVVTGILFTKGILQFPLDANAYISSKNTWFLEGFGIFLSCTGLIWVGKVYSETILKNLKKIKTINNELESYKNDLEVLVKERTSELESANNKLKSTNNELSHTLNQLNQTQEQLIESEKMATIGILTAGVAHEINNPLNFIQSGIYTLEQNLENKGTKLNHEIQQKVINNMNIGVERINDIVTSLNHFNRKSDDKHMPCSLHTIIENCLKILKNKTKHKCSVIKDYFKEEIVILGNEGKLHQIFLNILINGIQAIETKGDLKIKTIKEDRTALICIEDNGLGIPKENIKKIFDPFFTTKEAGSGTGLGLSIVYNLVKDHNGKIEIDSKEHEGTKVNIQFPIEN